MNEFPIKNIVIVVIIVIVFTGAYLLLSRLIKNDSLEYEEYLKDYQVNEYIATYVSDEDMAKIYLNDYIHNMYYDLETAYNSLDREYRDKKFGNINNYRNYIATMNYSTYNVVTYYKKEYMGYIIFGVYDQNGNFFAFKTKGVMQYSVFLDEDTVEIW